MSAKPSAGQNLRRMSDERLEREMAFAVGFAFDDEDGRRWEAAVRSEIDRRIAPAGGR